MPNTHIPEKDKVETVTVTELLNEGLTPYYYRPNRKVPMAYVDCRLFRRFINVFLASREWKTLSAYIAEERRSDVNHFGLFFCLFCEINPC